MFHRRRSISRNPLTILGRSALGLALLSFCSLSQDVSAASNISGDSKNLAPQSRETVGLTAAKTAGWGYNVLAWSELEFEGQRPSNLDASTSQRQWNRLPKPPRIVLDSPGEAYLGLSDGDMLHFSRARSRRSLLNNLQVAIRGPVGQPITGELFVPGSPNKGEEYTRHRFVTFTEPGSDVKDDTNQFLRRDFYDVKMRHYAGLLSSNLPARAWFRNRTQAIRQWSLNEFGDIIDDAGVARSLRASGLVDTNRRDFDRSFDLFTGGRALSENLKLNFELTPEAQSELTEKLADIDGINTPEMDWRELIKDINPKLDVLARYIPHDQHALFTPSLAALDEAVQQLEQNAPTFGSIMRPNAEHLDRRSFYENQLGFALDEVAKLMGGRLIKSLAITGSDPFYPTGTDFAVLFEAQPGGLLSGFMIAQHAARAKAAGLEVEEAHQGNFRTFAAQNSERSFSSFLATSPNLCILSNSQHQLDRVLATTKPDALNLAALDEYRYFRSSYPLGARADSDGDELAFLFLSDATIRRWCSPQWRIGSSRRVRARAWLAEAQSARMATQLELDPELPNGDPSLFAKELPVRDALQDSSAGPHSEIYGNLAFQRPIAELNFERVTQAERQSYERFRRGYQRNWRNFFDPIGVSVRKGESLTLDLTILPLIMGSDYNEFSQICGNVRLESSDGDPHPGTLMHFVQAIDREGSAFKSIENMSGMLGSQLASPLSWVGDWWCIYLEDGDVWEKLKVDFDGDIDDMLEDHLNEIPVCLAIENRNSLKLAAFMSAIRTLVDTSAPSLLSWEVKQNEVASYVEIKSSSFLDGSLFYATHRKALIFSLNEGVLQRALARMEMTDSAAPETEALLEHGQGWAGHSVGLSLQNGFLQSLASVFRSELDQRITGQSWAGAHVLNEYRRLQPAADPQQLHEGYFGARLRCPAGGEYVWNEEWLTYESTLCGHPAQPKVLDWHPMLETIERLHTGMTFINDGLRLRLDITKIPE